MAGDGSTQSFRATSWAVSDVVQVVNHMNSLSAAHLEPTSRSSDGLETESIHGESVVKATLGDSLLREE